MSASLCNVKSLRFIRSTVRDAVRLSSASRSCVVIVGVVPLENADRPVRTLALSSYPVGITVTRSDCPGVCLSVSVREGCSVSDSGWNNFDAMETG